MTEKPAMILVDATLSINRPIETVFAFLSNHENYVRWFPGVVSIESANSHPHGAIGKTYHETLRLPTGRNRIITIEVVDSRPAELFVMEGRFPPLHPRTEIRLSSKSGGETVLNWRFFSRSQSAIGRSLIRALIKRTVARQSEAGLFRLKSVLEEGI